MCKTNYYKPFITLCISILTWFHLIILLEIIHNDRKLLINFWYLNSKLNFKNRLHSKLNGYPTEIFVFTKNDINYNIRKLCYQLGSIKI